MRIHSDHLTLSDIMDAVIDGLPGVYISVSEHGSRTHKRAFEIALKGNSPSLNMANTGQAATWDEWGVVIARIFDRDAEAVFGSVKRPIYRSGGDFHFRTGYRFEDLEMPEDTHPRHTWDWVNGHSECRKCTAVQNRS